MATRGYVPDAGDVVWLEFDPQALSEAVERMSEQQDAHCSP